MNTLINQLSHDLNKKIMAHKQAVNKIISNNIERADRLKTEMHHHLSRPKISKWTFLMTILIANLLIGI